MNLTLVGKCTKLCYWVLIYSFENRFIVSGPLSENHISVYGSLKTQCGVMAII